MSNCAIVYDLAAQSNVLGAVSDSDYSFTSNVIGTYHVLKSAVAADVKRVVFSSSREVYGEVDSLPVSENQPTDAKNLYGASKVAGEAYCRVFQATHGIDINVLRLANVYGLGDRNRVIPNWLEQARTGEDLILYGGEQVLDFVPINLVVRALLRAESQSFHGLPVNIGWRRHPTKNPRSSHSVTTGCQFGTTSAARSRCRGCAFCCRCDAHARPAQLRATS